MHRKNFFGGGSVQKYYYYVQKYCLFWASCRNITGQEPWLLESHTGPFLGRVKKYWFLGEIITSAWGAPPLADFTDFVTRFLTPSLRGCGQSKADLLEEHPGLPGMPGASKKNVKIIG